jgi:uncharacterized lipoprotein YajG
MMQLRWFPVFLLSFILFGCAAGGVSTLNLRYEPSKELPSLEQKMGPTVAMAPFKDERTDTLYIGVHTPFQGRTRYFKSEPFPLETAIRESLQEVLMKRGLKTTSIPAWDGRPESLKTIDADSVLMIQIRKLWVDGRDDLILRTSIKASVHLTIHLGVKKEGKAFTKNVEVEREKTVFGGGTEHIGQMINEILTDVFDTFLLNPY